MVTLQSILFFTFFTDFAVFSKLLVMRTYHFNKTIKSSLFEILFKKKIVFMKIV